MPSRAASKVACAMNAKGSRAVPVDGGRFVGGMARVAPVGQLGWVETGHVQTDHDRRTGPLPATLSQYVRADLEPHPGVDCGGRVEEGVPVRLNSLDQPTLDPGCDHGPIL